MNRRQVIISGNIWVQDYEDIGPNQHASERFRESVIVDDNQPDQKIFIPPPKVCAGREVWPEIEFDVALWDATGLVRVYIDGNLYEGTSCNNRDLDGEYGKNVYVQPGESRTVNFSMENEYEGDPEDRAEINLSINNYPY